tara:strand:+ start:3093 stop:4655 length:1563 start_codon:yes stop_codon:yes gene_type:complete
MAEQGPNEPYPEFSEGYNKLTADLLNRMVSGLKTGDENWPKVMGMLRDTSRPHKGVVASPMRLVMIGDSQKASDGTAYGNMWMYEWRIIQPSDLSPRSSLGDGCAQGGTVAGFKLGAHEGDCPPPYDEGFSSDPAMWDEIGCWPGGEFRQTCAMNRGWIARFADCPCPQDCCTNIADPGQPTRFAEPCWCRQWAAGFACNIAELSLQMYSEPEDSLWPGTNISEDSCIAQELIDFDVDPVKRGSLAIMWTLSFTGTPCGGNQHPPTKINVIQVGNPVDGCCAPPAVAGASATGGVAFQQDGTNALLRTSDFKYDNATQTLTAPNISGDGANLTNVPTGGHPGYSTDTTREYMSPIHIGGDYGASHGTRSKFQPWYFPATTRTQYISVNGDDSGNTGQLNVAFYTNNNGSPGTKITGTGVTLIGNGTGNTEVAYDVTFQQGWYWMGSCVNTGTIDIEHTTSGTSGMRGFFPRDISGFGSDWGCFQSSASTVTVLPETMVIGDLQSQTNNIPRIGLRFQDVT